MLGGGFLRQMNETMKSNRDLLGKKKRNPFEKTEHKGNPNSSIKLDDKKLSEAEFQKLSLEIRAKVVRERRRELILFITLLIALLLLLYFFMPSQIRDLIN